MNSVQCPICGLQLEGDFEDTDEVKCPSCLATFVPSRIRHASNTSDSPQKSTSSAPRRQIRTRRTESVRSVSCPHCGALLEGNIHVGDTITCPACAKSFLVPHDSKSPVTNADARKQMPRREVPTSIKWASGWLVGFYCLFMAGAFLAVVFGAITSNDRMVDKAFSPFIGRFPQFFLTVLFAWKLYRGRNWARKTLNWILPIHFVLAILQGFGVFAHTAVSRAIETGSGLPHPSAFFVGLVISIILPLVHDVVPLVLINKQNSREWCRTPDMSSIPFFSRWWVSVVGGYIASVALALLISIPLSASRKQPRSAVSNTTFQTKHKPNIEERKSVAPPRTSSGFSSQKLGNAKTQETSQFEETKESFPVRAKDLRTVSLPGGTTMRFRGCPAGTFMMGSPDWEEGRFSDETRHRVTLTKGFWIGETEVTQRQWKSLMDNETVVDLARKRLQDDNEYFFGSGQTTFRAHIGVERDTDPARICLPPDEDSPMYYVNWFEAARFCARLTSLERKGGRLPDGYAYRLPTEAEWEYACRAGSTTSLPDELEMNSHGQNTTPALDELAWYDGNTGVGPRKVRMKKPNSWELYDMLGNVMEWCSDWFKPYPPGPVDDPIGPVSSVARVTRGGSWTAQSEVCRCAARMFWVPNAGNYNLGFRVVLGPENE